MVEWDLDARVRKEMVGFRKICAVAGMSFGVAAQLSSCRGEVDKNEPGSCPLQCSDPVIAGANYRIRPMGTLQSITCIGDFNGSVPLEGPQIFKFVVEAPRRVGAYNAGQGGAAPAAEPAGLNGPEFGIANTSLQETYLPVNNVSVQPIVLGPVYGYGTNDENATVERDEASKQATKVTPYKFAGVVTPKSQWCSDSCGVITMEVHFQCLSGASADAAVAIQSGSVSSAYQTFAIKHEKPTTTLQGTEAQIIGGEGKSEDKGEVKQILIGDPAN
jgi:hypothetical protein